MTEQQEFSEPADRQIAAAPDVQPDLETMSYEAAMTRLEQIVARLESGEATLDESMDLFQQGTHLSRICSARLASIEKKITQLVEQENGVIEEKPFGEDA